MKKVKIFKLSVKLMLVACLMAGPGLIAQDLDAKVEQAKKEQDVKEQVQQEKRK